VGFRLLFPLFYLRSFSSSIAIVLKILSEKDQIDSPHGRITLGILVLQDLAVVPMFIILPLLGIERTLSAAGLLLQLFLAFGSLALIIILSRFIMPRWGSSPLFLLRKE